MKALSILVFFCLSISVFAVPSSSPNGNGSCVARDTSSTNLPSAFGSAGTEIVSGLTKVRGVEIINKSSSELYASLSSTASNCTGGTKNMVVPANGYSTLSIGEQVFGDRVCLIGTTGTVSSGYVYVCTR